MRIATWNINSVRLRQELVLRLIDEAAPDIVCLQETKTPDHSFPHQPFVDLGYRHIAIAGMKGYNGVAVISRLPFESHEIRHWCGKE
uniref:endonuclease/exonuclease/phosphatase family protein n=1 Tax=Inquilinus sp. TaxID=1932117 RepID=UPI0031DFABBD